jgi:hypothetical protein
VRDVALDLEESRAVVGRQHVAHALEVLHVEVALKLFVAALRRRIHQGLSRRQLLAHARHQLGLIRQQLRRAALVHPHLPQDGRVRQRLRRRQARLLVGHEAKARAIADQTSKRASRIAPGLPGRVQAGCSEVK